MTHDRIVERVADALVKGSSSFPPAMEAAYRAALKEEKDPQARWTLETLLENADVAEKTQGPLCDDTGIPHLVLDVGEEAAIEPGLLPAIQEGVELGLRRLPGRPMAVKGDDIERIEQTAGLDPDPAAVLPAPIMMRSVPGREIRLHILMFGGGPAIRARTHRVFHKRSVQNIIDQIVEWATDSTTLLGCTPCTLTIGVGRSHYEASSMMIQALVDRVHGKQSEIEREITDRVNAAGVGPLGLGGKTTVLNTFLNVGPQRASGVRIVSMRPCCIVEPRMGSVTLTES